jgi:hypothetical protein
MFFAKIKHIAKKPEEASPGFKKNPFICRIILHHRALK